MRFITANTSPDHDTIADFRKRILPDLPGIFLQVLLIAKELDVLKVGKVSLDASMPRVSRGSLTIAIPCDRWRRSPSPHQWSRTGFRTPWPGTSGSAQRVCCRLKLNLTSH
jgi:hypothetical protein